MAVLAVAVAIGLLKRWNDGRFREVADVADGQVSNPADAGSAPSDPPSDPVRDLPGEAVGAPERAEHVGSRPAEADAATLTAADLGAPPGERATLVQFSSAFCAPCRATRQVLGDVAARIPGVRHVEIDAEANLELVRRLDVRRTPTTLVLDADGTIRTRASGAPKRTAVLAAVNDVLT